MRVIAILFKSTMVFLCILMVLYWISFYLLHVPAFINGLPQATFYQIADRGKVHEPLRRLRLGIAFAMGADGEMRYGGATLKETALRFDDEYTLEKFIKLTEKDASQN